MRVFAPLIGKKPWRSSLGWGSFLTFEFGQQVKHGEFWHGNWHLWIYMCSWLLKDGNRLIVSSDSDRDSIGRAVAKLTAYPLNGVEIEQRARRTTFTFGQRLRLACGPFDRLEEANTVDPAEYWMFFMPRNLVLTVRPGSRISIQRSDRAPYRE
jgi:hypothetical protein